MNYIKNIDKDEIRDGFLVTTDRKKIWNKLMELLVELDRICKKHSIKYFADSGTLIGAARHKGFIPWDDDIDVTMLRPDYEIFRQVANKELRKPFKLINAYTGDNFFLISKIMNTDTAAIEDMEAGHPQGIFLDIWPLDDMPDDVPRNKEIWEIRQTLLATLTNPNKVLKEIENGVQFKPSNEFVRKFVLLPPLERFKEYEIFSANHFGESVNIGCPFAKVMGVKANLKHKYYRDTEYLDFEGFNIAVPADYEKVLASEYSDWRKLVRAKSVHATEYVSTDMDYGTILSQINHECKK